MKVNGKETLLGYLLPPRGHLPGVLLQQIDEELGPGGQQPGTELPRHPAMLG